MAEAVHLYQNLVQGLLALVVAAAQAGATVAADGVDLIDKDDAWGIALGLVEKVTDAGGAHADEHLDEFRTADGEEGHFGLAGHGLGEEGLAGAGRASQQDAARDVGAQGGEPLRELEELHDLLELLLSLLFTRHVREGHGGAVGHDHASAASAEVHGLGAGTLGLLHHEQQQTAEENEGQEVQQQADEAAQAAAALYVNLQSCFSDVDSRSLQRLNEAGVGFLARGKRAPADAGDEQVVTAGFRWSGCRPPWPSARPG